MKYAKYFIAFLVVIAVVKPQIIEVPTGFLWGNPEFITYDAVRHVYINRNSSIENWRRGSKLAEPEEVPVKQKLSFSIQTDLFHQKETYVSVAALGMMTKQNQANRRFVLINVEETLLDLTKESDRQYRVWPHLGLLFVGTAAHEEGFDVILWDELVQGHAPLEKLVQPGDIVGISLVVTGIERGIKLAAQAKELGARYVIAGNDSAIFRAGHILALHRKPVDAVFTTNSVVAVRRFFREINSVGLESMRIPGVEIMSQGKGRSNNRSDLLAEVAARNMLKGAGTFDQGDVFIVPKLDLLPEAYWQEVWSNYRMVFGQKHKHPDTVRNAIALFAQGCTRTRGTDVCSYCTIAGIGDIRLPSREYLRRTAEAYKAFGIDTVFNATDSVFEMASVLQALKEEGISFGSMSIYGRAQGIARNPHLLDEWLSIVSDRLLINVGMDSGDSAMLDKGIVKSSLTSGSRVSENHQAIELVRASGAHLHYSLIFGSPGETLASCEKSIEFLEWSTGVLGKQLDIVETDFYWLNFGAPASQVFTDYAYACGLATLAGKTISKEDWQADFARHADELVVPYSAEEAWYRHFTQIDFETAKAFNNRAAAIMEKHTGSIRGRAFKPTV